MADDFYKKYGRYEASKAIERGKKSSFEYQLPPVSPGTKDCSSFVCYCYGIPRYGTGAFRGNLGKYNFKYIDNTKDFKKGDIVFYTAEQSNNGYGHTGIYIGDNHVMQMQGPNGRRGPQINGPNYATWHHVFRPPEGDGIYITNCILNPTKWKR